MTVHCRSCNHQWEVVMPLPMPLDQASQIMVNTVQAGCPNCGANGPDVLVGPARPRTSA